MDFKTIVFICFVILAVILLILFPELRSIFKGFTRLFVKDMATTPDGAKAIYEQKIDEAQKKYNIADDALRKAAGRLKIEEDKAGREKARRKFFRKPNRRLAKRLRIWYTVKKRGGAL